MFPKPFFILSILVSLTFLGCKEGGGASKAFEVVDNVLHNATKPTNPNGEKIVKKSETKKDGTVKKYRKNGKLLSETEYDNGVKRGLARSYYEDGSLYSEMRYEQGKKQGLAVWYYEDVPGKVYQETPYVDNKKHGLRKKYHKNGELMAKIPFEEDHLGKFVEEFDKSGKPVSDEAFKKFKIKPENRLSEEGKYLLKLNVSPYDKKAEYYAGKLTKEGFLHDELEKVPKKGGEGTVTVKLKLGDTVNEEVNFIAVTRTKLGNPLILERKYQLSISR